MDTQRIITGTEEEIWKQIEADLSDDVFTYDVQIRQEGHLIDLSIDIDLGGGFEGGYAITRLAAPVFVSSDFKFAVHDEGFIDGIGKFFGMQDVELGYPELDKHLVIKTNDIEKTRLLFANEEVRKVFSELEDLDFSINPHHTDNKDEPQATLELNIDDGITDSARLKQVYRAFYNVLLDISR